MQRIGDGRLYRRWADRSGPDRQCDKVYGRYRPRRRPLRAGIAVGQAGVLFRCAVLNVDRLTRAADVQNITGLNLLEVVVRQDDQTRVYHGPELSVFATGIWAYKARRSSI